MAKDIEYSEKYCDDHFEYRHVILPKSLKSEVPRNRLMSEQEWRAIGVTQSRGWMHYMIHHPEPHILLFRRPIRTDPRSGKAPANWAVPDDLTEQEKVYWIKDYNPNTFKQKAGKTQAANNSSSNNKNAISNSQNKENSNSQNNQQYY
mmetsp:Transcript_53334/g.85183  ORF Transcript_53334/g.85183 Transcript_53334/m.85183 type:complete len:148 (-) Transcript_53334:512-955(-)